MTEENRKKGAIEAVLFTMGGAVPIKVLSEALELEEKEIEELLVEMAAEYEAEDRGIHLIRLEDAYQLSTKAEYFDTLIRVASRPQRPVLTEVVLEVLSIISYKQPVTKGEIERIRGVSSDYAVNKLVDYGLVEEAGRLEAPGRPILFKTTEEFLRAFGLSDTTGLPSLSEEALEEARAAALKEAGEDPKLEVTYREEEPEEDLGEDQEENQEELKI